MRQRGDREEGSFNRDKELQPGGALRILPFSDRWVVVMGKAVGTGVPTKVCMHPGRAVMTVVVVVVQVRVQKWRTQRRQLQGGG